MSAWTSRIVELLGNTSKVRNLINQRGKYYYVEKEPRIHPDLGMVVTLHDEDGYRFTTSVKNIKIPQVKD
jgi:ribosomal protein L5